MENLERRNRGRNIRNVCLYGMLVFFLWIYYVINGNWNNLRFVFWFL